MVLSITTTHQPATDLGYLLHKHPDRYQTVSMKYGSIKVFFPEARDDRCTATLILDIDPIHIVRETRFKSNVMDQYVNDRPYIASSFMSVALSNVFRTALKGECKNREELCDIKIPLTATIPVIQCRGGEQFTRELFESLGYHVELHRYPLTITPLNGD